MTVYTAFGAMHRLAAVSVHCTKSWIYSLSSTYLNQHTGLCVAIEQASQTPFSYNIPTFPNLIHSSHNHLPMKMEKTECSEMSAHKIQTPGNNPEDSTQHLEHGESLKSGISCWLVTTLILRSFTKLCQHTCFKNDYRSALSNTHTHTHTHTHTNIYT